MDMSSNRKLSRVRSSSDFGLDRTALAILLLLIPFFEPLCFSYLKEVAGFEMVGGFFDFFFMGYRICSVFIILILFSTKVRFNLALGMIALMGFFSCLSVVVMNNSGTIKALYEAAAFLALGIFLFYEWREHPDELVTACTILFTAFSILSLASVWLTGARGIASAQANSQAAKDAIFFFGGKNSVFIYNLPTILFLCFYEYRKKGIIGFTPSVVALLFCITSILIDSASSTFFFFLVFAFCVAARFAKKGTIVKAISQPIFLLAVFAFVFVFIVMMGGRMGIVSSLLELFGRSPTFSGRTGIWQQALSDIDISPFLGGGGALTFTIGSTTTPHAHSFYLNAFAQYGIFYFVVLVLDLVLVCVVVRRNNSKKRNCILVSLSVFAFYMLVIHSVFDFLSLPLYFLLRSCILDGMSFFEIAGKRKA